MKVSPEHNVCRTIGLLAGLSLTVLLSGCAPEDTTPPFVKVKGASVDVQEYSVFARIYLEELPESLPYNAPDLAENGLEYEWRVLFDVDGDKSWANDIGIVLAKFKFPGSEPGYGNVTAFAQHSVVQVDDSGWGSSKLADSRVQQEGNVLVLGVLKRQHEDLMAITHSTPWRIQTYFGKGDKNVVDYYPANGGYFIP